jgi:NCS1 family nucleobase:cation symporter-1
MPPSPEIINLTTDLSASPYYSKDMAPIPSSARKWATWDIAALWISMSACITTYTLASTMITGGMNWWQAILTIFLGNAIVLIPMVLNAHAGTRYGIPFPVYCRASFGLRGANLPALLRAFIACGWFGIQTWFGGEAVYTILAVLFPSLTHGAIIPAIGLTAAQAGCFLLFWLINMLVVYAGIDSIRILLNIKAPLLILLGLVLLGWAYQQAGGFGPMLSQPSAFAPGQPQAGHFWAFFFPALTGVVGYWATLSLNIPDFSRYAYSQKAQIVGQAIGLPATMALYSFIGVAVTSATMVIFRDPKTGALAAPIWDPVILSTHFKNPVILIIAALAMCLATLATNIAANIVSPANDFAHLAPKFISFRTGGLITGILGILIMPWKLVADPSGYIFTWLIGSSSLLGAIGGILIADYFWIRKTRLDLPGLYQKSGPYFYVSGINPIALLACLVAVAPCIPGFLNTVGLTHFPDFLTTLYHYAWFLSFTLAFLLYGTLTLSRSTVTRSNVTPSRGSGAGR